MQNVALIACLESYQAGALEIRGLIGEEAATGCSLDCKGTVMSCCLNKLALPPHPIGEAVALGWCFQCFHNSRHLRGGKIYAFLDVTFSILE